MISEVDIKDWPTNSELNQDTAFQEKMRVHSAMDRVNKSLKNNEVEHPPHYNQGGVGCIVAIQAALTPEEFRGYCKGNVLKYVWRERHKAGVESLQKAQWYLNRLVGVSTSG